MEDEKYFNELHKFEGKDVVVENYTTSGKIVKTTGILYALNYKYLNVILMTKTEKILIRNFYRITRLRKQ